MPTLVLKLVTRTNLSHLMCAAKHVLKICGTAAKRSKCLNFGVPMVWREGKDHSTNRYFCMTNLQGKLQ
jgi:hypothetical protein